MGGGGRTGTSEVMERVWKEEGGKVGEKRGWTGGGGRVEEEGRKKRRQGGLVVVGERNERVSGWVGGLEKREELVGGWMGGRWWAGLLKVKTPVTRHKERDVC